MTPIDRESRLPELFDLERAEHAAIFDGLEWPWEAVGRIGGYLETLLSGPYPPGLHSAIPLGAVFGPDVYLGPGCIVEPGVFVKGPAWIGRGSVLRQGLYCRENILAEEGVTLGHACELKNCYLLPGAEVPHFNYVGDSILGSRAHLGAGVILSNLRLDKRRVQDTDREQGRGQRPGQAGSPDRRRLPGRLQLRPQPRQRPGQGERPLPADSLGRGAL